MSFDQFGGRRDGSGGGSGEANQAVLDATPESERADGGGPERTDDGEGLAEPSPHDARSAVGDSVGDTDRDLVDAAPGDSNGDGESVVEAAPAGKVTLGTDRQVGESEPVGIGRSAANRALAGAPDQEFVGSRFDDFEAADRNSADSSPVGGAADATDQELVDSRAGDVQPSDSHIVVESTSIDDATSDTDREALGSSSSDAGRSDADPDAAGDVDQELVDTEPTEPEVADGRPAASVKVAAFDADQDVADSGSVGDAAAGTDRPAETAAIDQRAEPPYSPLRVPDATGRRPSDALFTFEPDKAGLPPLTMEQGERYLETVDLEKRPWLKGIDDCSREARYVIAAIDLADGHYLPRHEGNGSGDAGLDRVLRLRDPGNADQVSRNNADDAFAVDEDGKPARHGCGFITTSINDLEAFAIAFAAAVQHPQVHTELTREYDPSFKVQPVRIPIGKILGASGHEYCEGYRLISRHANLYKAAKERDDWVEALLTGRVPTVPAPTAEQIASFELGNVVCAFSRKFDLAGYYLHTIFPEPPK